MLFGYEFKKIWRRVSPILLIVCLVGIAAVTMLTSLIAFNHVPATPTDVDVEYAALADKINHWDLNRQLQASKAFDNFYAAYKHLNTDTATASDAVIISDYQSARNAFENFYSDYYHQLTSASDYLLVKGDDITALDDVLIKLDAFFVPELENATAIRKGLKINATWEAANIETVLSNLQIQIMTDENLTTLQQFFTNHPANIPDQNYHDAYDYAVNYYWLSIDHHTPHDENLNQYQGFTDYQNQDASTQAIITAEYRLNHPDQNFAQPFAFGKIYNNGVTISLLDFVFTNLEMAAIPLLLLVIIVATAAFFTDTYQNTIITAVAATKNRTLVIVNKALVVLTLSVVGLLLFTALYLISGWLFFQGTLTNDILFLFNGRSPIVMSAINYLVLYLVGLVFKILPFIALAGIFSLAKTKPIIIVGSTLAVIAILVLVNALLGGFAFYRFMPWQALDPLRYCGATLFISPTPAGSNLWYTFPVMWLLVIYLYWQLVHNFRHRDF